MKAKFKFMCALVVCVLGLPIAAPAAEQNPLQSLVNALGRLAPANASQSESPQPELPGGASPASNPLNEDAEILGLLEVQADDNYETTFKPWRCEASIFNLSSLEKSNKSLQMEVARGDYGGASAVSNNAAKHIAYCAAYRYKNERAARQTMDGHMLNLSLADWAEIVGMKVVAGLKYAKAFGLDLNGAIEQKSAARAKALLMYAKSKETPNADAALKALSDLTGVKIAKASESADLSGSAVSLVEKFNANKFGFEQKYLGKTIETYGTVLTVSGSKKYASVAILGNTKLSMDDLGFQHRIECIVTSPESMSKAGDLQKGKKVRVRGVFDHDTRFNMMAESQINLSGCEILR